MQNSSDPLVARSCDGMWNELYSRCEGLGVHVFVAGEKTWKGDLTACLHSQQDHMVLHIMLGTCQASAARNLPKTSNQLTLPLILRIIYIGVLLVETSVFCKEGGRQSFCAQFPELAEL